jgi:hypothetical protein
MAAAPWVCKGKYSVASAKIWQQCWHLDVMGISKLKFESVCKPKNGCGKLNIDRKILGMVSSFYQPFCDWGWFIFGFTTRIYAVHWEFQAMGSLIATTARCGKAMLSLGKWSTDGGVPHQCPCERCPFHLLWSPALLAARASNSGFNWIPH